MLNTWQFNLIGYLIAIIFFFQFYKLAVKNTARDGASTVLLQITAGLSVLALSPFLAFKFPTDLKFYLLLLGACIFYALNDRMQTTARRHLEVSAYSILNQLSNVFLIIIGVLVFRESVTLAKILGASLILGGNGVLLYKKQRFELNKYSIIAILASIVFAIAISIDIGISRQFNLPFYIMLTLIVPAIFVYFGERIKLSEVIAEYNSRARNYYLITGIAWGFVIFFSLRAFQLGKVTTIVPLEATAVLMNVVVAVILFKERDNLPKKIFAAALVIVGVYATVLA